MLLIIDMSDIIEIRNKLFRHQIECIQSKKDLVKCLINIWCGGGKTRIITYSIFEDGKELNVIVFPSLGLINQFNNDYILSKDFMEYFKEYKCLSVCSDSESKLKIKSDIIKYTTNENKIKSTLKKSGKKLITVTYQSLEMFMNIIVSMDIRINRLYYDEAHHILGSAIQQIVFKNEELNLLIDKTEYYTATPDNKNGITMYDRDNDENSDCGPIVYEYLFYQAVEDKISKDFTMKLMLYPKTVEDKYINLFESVFRECFSGEYDYWNILTFHSKVEEKDEQASVNDIVKPENQKLFKLAFQKVIKDFPEKKELYSVDNIFLKGVGAKTKNREKIIEDFDTDKEKGRIYLLASCKTLGEGIDTKYANMEIPVNPGGSVVYEQQKLGRITRNPGRNQPNGIVLIPCWIDMEQYEGLDTMERDEMIRQELHEGGNFNTFLNVMSAYKNQCDPELWELCLKYPKMYSPKEIKSNLDKQGFKVDESKGNLIENINHIIDEDITELVGETDEETIHNIIDKTDKQVEIHSQDKELPIITYGSNTGEEPIRLFKDEEAVYHPVSKKDPSEPRKKIEKPYKLKRKKLVNVHMNDEIKVLWKIVDSFDVNNAFCHGVLDAVIEYDKNRFEKWYVKLELVKTYIDKNKILPTGCNPDIEVKSLGLWIYNQKNTYKKQILIMNDVYIRKLWEEFINDYSEYFKSNEEIWIEKLKDVEKYIDTNEKLPSCNDNDNEKIKSMGSWISTQKSNYYDNKNIMKNNPDIKGLWEEFADKYNEYFKSNEEIWYENLEKLKQYIDKNKNKPRVNSNNDEIQKLALWMRNQQKSYKDNIYIMKLSKEIRNKWEEFINNYEEYFLDSDTIWRNNLKNVIKYIEENNKKPPNVTKDIYLKKLNKWINNNKKYYKNNLFHMNKPEIKKEWEEFMNKYKKYFLTGEEIWLNNIKEVKKYIDENNKIPSYNDDNDEIKNLGKWLNLQSRQYKENDRIMKQSEIRKLWEEFINKYEEYFLTGEEIWLNNIKEVKKYIDENNQKPSPTSKNNDIKRLGRWLSTQNNNYKNDIYNMIINLSIKKYWEDFIKEYKQYFLSDKEIWYGKLNDIKKYIETNKRLPTSSDDDKTIKCMGRWISTQSTQFKKKEKIMKQPEIRKKWEEFIETYSEYFKDKKKKDMSKKEIKPKKESIGEKRIRFKSEMSILHQKYKTMNSQTLHNYFEENPQEWDKYHKISESNEESFPDEEVPYKKIIEYLEKIPGKKNKDVADLGCGKARVSEHFSDNNRFKFINMDHIACSDSVIKKDIKNTELDDYSMDVVILSLAMWGSNCKEYIYEANRILDENGVLLIIEATTRWTKDGPNRLVELLEDNNFTIKNINEEKFMFIECIKK